jgi:hypothetical protein
MAVLFWIFFLNRSVQNGSNLIKLAQIGFLTHQKMFLNKVVTFTNWIKIAILFWIRSVQNGLNLTKLVQIGSNWFTLVHIGSHWFTLVQISLNWFKSDKIGWNWIKSNQFGSNWFKVEQIRLIGPNWTKLD